MSTPLFTPSQVREMDERAIARGVGAAVLMERAAGLLARTIVDWAGYGYGLKVGILAGRGNNGGDGLAAARRLAGSGARARVAVVGGAEGLEGLPGEQLRRFRQAGGRVVASAADALDGADVVVDCLLGTGSSGPPRGEYASAVAHINASSAGVVACDQPTGVDAATGEAPADAVRADTTLVLGAEKLGLRLSPARGHCGTLRFGDIGILDGAADPVARMLDDASAAALLPPPAPTAHKRSRGVVVIVAGSKGMSGAAVLSARGALGAGAGLVTVCSDAHTCEAVARSVPEVLTAVLPDDAEGSYEAVASLLERADALAVGPGLGTDGRATTLIRRLVADATTPLVLDADGLNAFADNADDLAQHASPLLVLTPHAGEYARLSSTSWNDRARNLVGQARAWNAVVVAKGPSTLTAAPDARAWVNQTGGPMLATGGTGDVLTGMTAALLAAGADAGRVAAGVHLHGLAGQLAGVAGSPRAVTAGGVVDALGPAWQRLERAA